MKTFVLHLQADFDKPKDWLNYHENLRVTSTSRFFNYEMCMKFWDLLTEECKLNFLEFILRVYFASTPDELAF